MGTGQGRGCSVPLPSPHLSPSVRWARELLAVTTCSDGGGVAQPRGCAGCHGLSGMWLPLSVPAADASVCSEVRVPRAFRVATWDSLVTGSGHSCKPAWRHNAPFSPTAPTRPRRCEHTTPHWPCVPGVNTRSQGSLGSDWSFAALGLRPVVGWQSCPSEPRPWTREGTCLWIQPHATVIRARSGCTLLRSVLAKPRELQGGMERTSHEAGGRGQHCSALLATWPAGPFPKPGSPARGPRVRRAVLLRRLCWGPSGKPRQGPPVHGRSRETPVSVGRPHRGPAVTGKCGSLGCTAL